MLENLKILLIVDFDGTLGAANGCVAGLDALGDAARVHEGHLRVGLPEEREATPQRAFIGLLEVAVPVREGLEKNYRIGPLRFRVLVAHDFPREFF